MIPIVPHQHRMPETCAFLVLSIVPLFIDLELATQAPLSYAPHPKCLTVICMQIFSVRDAMCVPCLCKRCS